MLMEWTYPDLQNEKQMLNTGLRFSTSNCRKITHQTFYKIIDKAINCGKIFFHKLFLVSKKHKITYILLKI